jgi:hypothetical protein
MNEILGLNAPLQGLSEIEAKDPVIDLDGDGWVVGPDDEGSGFT